MIEMIRVNRTFAKGRGLHDISLHVDKGEWVGLVGNTGAGKTTILRLLYAADRQQSGEVIVGQYRLSKLKKSQEPKLRKLLGVVDQDLSLMPDRNVLRNVSIVGEVLGWSKKETKQKSLRVLNQVGLYAHLDASPLTLSFGEKRRLAIARALVVDPLILIADEPLGNLDRETAEGIVGLLRDIHLAGTSMLVTTHRPELFEGCPIRIVEISKGRIVA